MAKRRISQARAANRYTATEIINLITAQHGPVSWRELVERAGADTPRAITQLRQMVKGLQRNDEIQRDHLGAYHVRGAEPVSEAIVRRTGRTFHAAGVVIDNAQKYSLREGDAVQLRVVGDKAHVLDVISHAETPVTGVLQWRGRYPYVEGLGAYRGRVSLLEPPVAGQHGDTVQVRIVDRDRRGLVGVLLEVIETESVLDQAIKTAVAGAHMPDEWPAQLLSEVDKLPRSVRAGGYADRVDLTGLPLVTIDGETAKDFDDAVFVEALPGRRKGWRLVVAIADVAHYVKPNSAIDLEAVNRGTSAYFPERVIPMLPEALSNGLCSLRPEVPRLALVCDMSITQAGAVVEHDFYEAVIHSHARLTYEQVEAFIDSGTPLPVKAQRSDSVHASVEALAGLHVAMREVRDKRGALDFATREGLVVIAQGAVSSIEPVQRLRAHQLIEEAMIAANVCAAQFLEAFEQPSLYRVHEPPDAAKIEELRQALAYVGVRLAPGKVDPPSLQRALSRLPDTAEPWLYAQLALRSLQQAVYTPDNVGHYGLALERYMHFTSPIRRYPDLLVHRAIKAVLRRRRGARPQGKLPSVDELHMLGETCSNNERRAEGAAWLVDAWLKCDFLQDRVGETMDGIIAGVTEFGLFVELEGYYVQGLLHVSNLGADYFQFNARSLALVGESSGRRFSLGDKLRVIVAEIEPPQGKIDLQLVEPGRRRKSSGKSRRGRRR